jgi:spoIIIJ-associated protein
MSQPTSIEVTANDVEAAIEQGIAKLGVSRDAVMVEVLEEPQRRMLGLGATPARVRLTVIRAPSTPPPAAPSAPAPPARSAFAPSAPAAPSAMPDRAPERDEPQRDPGRGATRSDTREDYNRRDTRREPRGDYTRRDTRSDSRGTVPRYDSPRPEGRSSYNDRRPYESRGQYGGTSPSRPPRRNDENYDSHPAPRPYADLDEEYDEQDVPVSVTPEELAEDARVGSEVLKNILKHMQVRAAVYPHQAETTPDEPEHWILEIRGQELALLIGRRGETLAALQYITRLITSRQLGRRANIVIDVEGYKARRETMLKRLANRMAEQAIQRGRTVVLEPMPPHERRIIHLTLRQHPDVTTESVGEGDRRKVTIVPKKPGK